MMKIIIIGIIILFCGCHGKAVKNNNVNSVKMAIEQGDRTVSDKLRDARSRPDVTLKMMDIGPGDVVFDVFAGGGYYSELIARVVGDDGKVYLHNNQAYRNFVKNELAKRMKNNRFPQMIQYDREADDLGMASNYLDAAMIIMSYHDLFYDDSKNGWAQIDHQDFMQQIYDGLKVGGRFLIVDHDANEGRKTLDSQSLHRIEKQYAIERIEAIGFRLVEESAVISNSDDDKSTSVFSPGSRGKTDRFIIVFEKNDGF